MSYPLFNYSLGSAAVDRRRSMSFDEYAGSYLPAGSGVKAQMTQVKNEAYRRCRIRTVKLKSKDR